MKNRWLQIASLVLAAAGFAAAEAPTCTGKPRFELPQLVLLHRNELRAAGDRLRVASYNIQDFTDGVDDSTNRTPERVQRQARGAAAALDEINADVVLIEEVENGRALQALNGSLKKPYPVAYITRFAGRQGDRTDVKLNIAVLSRVPISGLREMDFGGLSGKGCPPRGLLSFIVDLGQNHRLLVYGVHLKSNYGDAARNVAQRFNALSILRSDVAGVLNRYPGLEWEILVAGDMNVDPEDRQFASDRSLEPLRGWLDLWRGRPLAERVTLPTRRGDPMLVFPPVTFDRFFASPDLSQMPWVAVAPGVLQRGVDTNNVFTVGGENDLQVSDHYPVYLDLVR